jgi:hypothetical protein
MISLYSLKNQILDLCLCIVSFKEKQSEQHKEIIQAILK